MHEPKTKEKFQRIATAAGITLTGLFLFKYIPMSIWGQDILFDASAHIATTIIGLYILWFFVDQNKRLHSPFLLFCIMILIVVALQRIVANAHNDIGLLLGLLVGLSGIGVAERKKVHASLKF